MIGSEIVLTLLALAVIAPTVFRRPGPLVTMTGAIRPVVRQ